jgi:hypothetical protein
MIRCFYHKAETVNLYILVKAKCWRIRKETVIFCVQSFVQRNCFLSRNTSYELCVPLTLLMCPERSMEVSSVCFASVRLPCLKFKAAVNTSYQFKYMSLASGLISECKRSDHLPCPVLERTRRRQRVLRSTLAHAHTHTRTHSDFPANIFPISG